MNTPVTTKAVQFYAQAAYFLEAAMAVTRDVAANKDTNPIAYSNYETVIVGTHHAFAMEIILKGYIFFHTDEYPHHEHRINELMDNPACSQLKKDIQRRFEKSNPFAFTETQMNTALDSYIADLDQSKKEDRKEEQNIRGIRRDADFGTLDYFLKLHSNHFIRMRYACEKLPPPLDMTFTSFLCSELRDALRATLNL
jgi:hypothetical protein